MNILIFILIAIGLFVVDLILKLMIQKKPENWAGKSLNSHIFLCRFYNQGAAMGMLKNHRKILNVVTVASIGILSILFGWALGAGRMIEKIAFMLVNAGAWNNAYERIVKKQVTDYINFPKAPGKVKEIVFNLSDFLVLIGGLLYFISDFTRRK